MYPLRTYTERTPTSALAPWVRTVWMQHTGDAPMAQRDLPTGGVEIACPVGGAPTVLGALTRARVQWLPARTTVVGARFWPGTAAPILGVPARELVDRRLPLDELWADPAARLAGSVANAPGPESALDALEDQLSVAVRMAASPDPLVIDAVRELMPWGRPRIEDVTRRLAISESQLRRRFLDAVGIGPKATQRTLRFQGYLALAQAAGSGPGLGRTVGDIAAEVGYADHAHLSRECLRLSGVTPRILLGNAADRCGCGHDHAASYLPFLSRRAGRIAVEHAGFVQDPRSATA